jgi:hypothetical protein
LTVSLAEAEQEAQEAQEQLHWVVSVAEEMVLILEQALLEKMLLQIQVLAEAAEAFIQMELLLLEVMVLTE